MGLRHEHGLDHETEDSNCIGGTSERSDLPYEVFFIWYNVCSTPFLYVTPTWEKSMALQSLLRSWSRDRDSDRRRSRSRGSFPRPYLYPFFTRYLREGDICMCYPSSSRSTPSHDSGLDPVEGGSTDLNSTFFLSDMCVVVSVFAQSRRSSWTSP